MLARGREARENVRYDAKRRNELQTLRGSTASALLHPFRVRAIVQNRNPRVRCATLGYVIEVLRT